MRRQGSSGFAPRPSLTHRLALLVAAGGVAASLAVPGPAWAVDVDWEPPTASGALGAPLSFTQRFRSPERPILVELLTRLPAEDTVFVQEANLSGATGEGYRATVVSAGQTLPNTRLSYRFRITTASGVELGPEAEITYRDERYDWRTVEGEVVRVHWYEGDDAFARRALDIGEQAVDEVSELLGVVEDEPIDFFIYASSEALYGALGPGTRENVGGQAHAEIRTLFGLIEPSEIGSSWVEVVIPHELTHLVFDTAVDNPYNFPPHWLDEGIAVYLSEGYGVGHRAEVSAAIAADSLMPLEGLVGQFPTSRDRFSLGYAESVSAVDFFVRTHEQERLVDLVRSYGGGVSDDEAFVAATGEDFAAFEAAWLDDLGAETPQAYGPRPAPPGPLPPDWTEPSPDPGGLAPTAIPGGPDEPGPTPAPTRPGSDERGRLDPLVVLGLAAIAALVAVGLGMLTTRSRRPPGVA